MNKDNWFFQYFPKLKETADYEVEMITMMSMNVFTPNKIRPGAPNAFTMVKISSWFNVSERNGVGLELPYHFMDTEAGLEQYYWFLGGMAAALDLQITVDIYTRLNQCGDNYAKWKMLHEDPVESLREVVNYYREDFNSIHSDALWAFQKINKAITDREKMASLNISTDWIVCDHINIYLTTLASNSLNKNVGQYNLNGDAAINKIEGMKNITQVAGKNVAIQEHLVLGEKLGYNPMHALMRFGHHYTLNIPYHDNPMPTDHQ
jgi:hypothetical protein